MFTSPHSLDDFISTAPGANEAAVAAARARQDTLTKPPGSLGRLEDVACWLAGWQAGGKPRARNVQVIVFAGNHGVTARGVSPYPAEVTAQMVLNFEAGGAAINALSNMFGHAMQVVPLDLDTPTQDFTRGPAMSEKECLQAMITGASTISDGTDILVLGEMGIGNTTSAAALATALFGGRGADWVGPGTGHDAAGVVLKAAIVDEAIALHRDHLDSMFEIIRRLGGRELAAITGAVAAARRRRLPVVLDGFIATAAAAVLTRVSSRALDHCIAGHVSAEPAHRVMLERLGLEPLMDLGMRLGEGSGAALAVQVLKAAAATHNSMASFAEAGVSNRPG